MLPSRKYAASRRPATWAVIWIVAGDTTVPIVLRVTVTFCLVAVATFTGGGDGGFLAGAKNPGRMNQASSAKINAPLP